MNMTPETDGAAVLPRPMAYADGFIAMRALACKLERERDAARAKLAKCREALKQIAESTVMRSHDSGECIAAEHREAARETLEATHLVPSQKES